VDGTVQESVRGRLLYSVCFGRCRSNSLDELFGILGGLHLVSFLRAPCLPYDWNNNFMFDIFGLKIMRIKDLKEYKTRLHRLVRYMLGAELVLAFLITLAYANYLAISSNSIFGSFFVAFIDILVVLVILDIILSD
jgi:hypothetical protein